MSNPTPTPTNRGLANLERTRNQLQELDSLLQQMLALPLAEQPAPPPPAAQASATVPPTSDERELPHPKRLQSLATARPAPAGEAAADLKRALPLPLLKKPESPKVEEPAKPAVAVLAARGGVPVDFDPALMDLSGPATFDVGHDQETEEGPRGWGSGRTPSAPRRPLVYRTLVDFNLMFDRSVGLLGPLGRPLSSETGKAWLGWLGLVCLLGAAALGLGLWLGWSW